MGGMVKLPAEAAGAPPAGYGCAEVAAPAPPPSRLPTCDDIYGSGGTCYGGVGGYAQDGPRLRPSAAVGVGEPVDGGGSRG